MAQGMRLRQEPHAPLPLHLQEVGDLPDVKYLKEKLRVQEKKLRAEEKLRVALLVQNAATDFISKFGEPEAQITNQVLESGSRNAANIDQFQLSVSEAPIETNDQIVEMKSHFKVICWLLPISAGGILGILAGLFGNEKASLTHKVLFKLYTFFIFASFLSCLPVLLIYFCRTHIRPTICIVNVFMWAALGTVVYAIAFAICMLIPMGITGMVLVIISPFFPLGIVLVIYINNRCGKKKNELHSV